MTVIEKPLSADKLLYPMEISGKVARLEMSSPDFSLRANVQSLGRSPASTPLRRPGVSVDKLICDLRCHRRGGGGPDHSGCPPPTLQTAEGLTTSERSEAGAVLFADGVEARAASTPHQITLMGEKFNTREEVSVGFWQRGAIFCVCGSEISAVTA